MTEPIINVGGVKLVPVVPAGAGPAAASGAAPSFAAAAVRPAGGRGSC